MIYLNFTISELLYSEKAKVHGIDNMPKDPKIFDNILTLIVDGLQPIRDLIGKPMIITSGYRCESLNKLVGGATNSQHLKGQAVDFVVKGMTVQEVINFIKNSGIEYDQLINEYDKWVHISFVKGKNRKQTPFKIG